MKKIVSTTNGFAVQNENGEVISTFDRDALLEQMMSDTSNAKQVLSNVINYTL